LCGAAGHPFFEATFYSCPICKGIYRPLTDLPSPEKEKERYLKHRNNPSDSGYRNFVAPLFHAITNDFNSRSKGLDFGAGTGSAIAEMLTEKDYDISRYDPFFCDNKMVLNKDYDFIICCEVIEHFHFPINEFNLLYSLLKHKSALYCMTDLYEDKIDFSSWYYKNDFTHVFIYRKETIEWIKNNYGLYSETDNNRLIRFYRS
jgi:hypothetical protein